MSQPFRPSLLRPSRSDPPAPPAGAGGWGRRVAFGAVAGALLVWGTPPVALLAGLVFAWVAGAPRGSWSQPAGKWLMQGCVVLLGFGLELPVVLRVGADGALFAAVTITATLLAGWGLGCLFALDRRTSTLISSGTAICGGSAIAAVSTVIAATQAEIAVSIGTVFVLNAAALYVFPVAGHWLGLSEAQFGLWAGVAIHDVSSVVGAGLSYGPAALGTATAVKLSRTLWIIPLTFGLALGWGRGRGGERTEAATPGRTGGVAIPWFIGGFLLASLARSSVPAVAAWAPAVAAVAHRGMVLVLFLIGTSLSWRALREVGWRTFATGAVLWLFISVGSLLAIRGLSLVS